MKVENRVKTVFEDLASDIDPAPDAWHRLVTTLRARQRRHRVLVSLLVLLVVGGGAFGVVHSWPRSSPNFAKPNTDQTGSKPLLIHGTLRLECCAVAPGPQHPRWEAGVQLTFVSKQDQSRAEVVTDAFGRFSLRLRPGQYRVVIAGPGAKAFSNGNPMQPQPNVIVVAEGSANQFPLVIEGI